MKIIFEQSEAEQYFYDALCNGLGQIGYYGCELDYKAKDYKQAKEKLESTMDTMICYEDILMQILRDGNELTIVDEEGGDDERYTITMKDVHERMNNVPFHNINNILQSEDDAYDADAIIQTVFFQDVIFG
jgi:hypothetical protein